MSDAMKTFEEKKFANIYEASFWIGQGGKTPEQRVQMRDKLPDMFPEEYLIRLETLDVLRQWGDVVGKASEAPRRAAQVAMKCGPKFGGKKTWEHANALANTILEDNGAKRGQHSNVPAAKPTRRQKGAARAKVRKAAKKAKKSVYTRPSPESLPTPGPRAEVLRSIIDGAKDPKLCQFMAELVPLAHKYNGTTEKAVALLFAAANEGMPILFVAGALA